MKKQVFRWKQGARISIDPQVAGEAIERIKKDRGELRPQYIVDAAKAKSHPLHDAFEWNNTKAAESWRVEQAKYLTRSLEIVVQAPGEPPRFTRYYISQGSGIGDGKESRYYTVAEVLSDSEMREQRLRRVWNMLLSIKHEYEDLIELAAVWDAISEQQKKVLKEVDHSGGRVAQAK